MDEQIHQGLTNRLYEKRKAAAYDLERIVREAVAANDERKIRTIIKQLCSEFIFTPSRSGNIAFGGLIGLAGTAIALGCGKISPRHHACRTFLFC